MKNQHTPGPWTAVVTDTTCGGEPAIWEISDKHGGVIAEDISHNPANANLIASAPDLLSAIKALAMEVECILVHDAGDTRDRLIESLFMDNHGILLRARAAISKAEGLA